MVNLQFLKRNISSSAAPLDVWSQSKLESVNFRLIKPTKKNSQLLQRPGPGPGPGPGLGPGLALAVALALAVVLALALALALALPLALALALALAVPGLSPVPGLVSGPVFVPGPGPGATLSQTVNIPGKWLTRQHPIKEKLDQKRSK